MIVLKDILTQQKKASVVCADILFEVIKMAKQEHIPVGGSAFEADHQLISLKNQNIIDFILTNDGDIPFQGSERTIMNLSKATAHCNLITREAVLQGLKEMFDLARELDNYDLKYLACMLGNDYVNQVKGEGLVACTNKMKTIVKTALSSREQWIHDDHVQRMETPEHRQRFNHSLQIWEHAPAFGVVSNNSNTPRQVFHSTANNEYNVELRLMMGSVESNGIQFWINGKGDKNDNINNLRIGFNPHTHNES